MTFMGGGQCPECGHDDEYNDEQDKIIHNLENKLRILQHDRDLAMKNMLKQEKEVSVLLKKIKDTVETMEDVIQEYYES